jgi:hypothetical protein
MTPEERDAIRAEIVRSRLHSLESPDKSTSTQETNPGDA